MATSAEATAKIGTDGFKVPLFVYGTLKDREIRVLLFGREVEHCEGALGGHRLLSSDGFFLVKREAGFSVRGMVLFLEPDLLDAVDRWEGVPYYTRSVERVLYRGRESLAWVYSRPGVEGRDADDGGICDLPRDEVLEAVRALAQGVRRAGP